ncbi:MYXO-CTERM sorting domain-containing protein [Polyangium sorediatum]|uniref:MYXO-CTERM sorting domain-containing protein n=1 Tax=Polyangium sorediatum TaxID=889274 RepID=A0ABT6P6M1_9BACT|nr:MYXO-CTERM sorting domain-containing protein [Polyangium sorediatum]MDI1435830.1 MYXO-CTERM sorting domain-containing protein [Polyangium sorediatum]
MSPATSSKTNTARYLVALTVIPLALSTACGSELPTSEAMPEEITPAHLPAVRKDESNSLLPTYDAVLHAADGTQHAWFGADVALDGETALIAASGGAYVFVREELGWTEQAHFVSDDPEESGFGAGIAIQGDTALVGAAIWYVDQPEKRNATHVFVRDGVTWTKMTTLRASDGTNADYFGAAVSLSGKTALIGAPDARIGATEGAGAAYVFVEEGGMWKEQAKLVASDSALSGWFGTSVALDGDTALVGAWTEAPKGAAYVFEREGATWTQTAKLVPSDGEQWMGFGVDVALDGDRALIAAGNTVPGAGPGSAYIFERSGGTWVEKAQLLPKTPWPPHAHVESVALDGDTAIVALKGLLGETAVGEGAARVFQQIGDAWVQKARLEPQIPAPGSWFGSSCALSGNVALIGAQLQTIDAIEEKGAAHAFELVTETGDACATGDDCPSGVCVDGICCGAEGCPEVDGTGGSGGQGADVASAEAGCQCGIDNTSASSTLHHVAGLLLLGLLGLRRKR